MKLLLALAALSMLAAGCTKDAGAQSTNQPSPPTFGTAIGSSFQGANQNNPETTATRSDDTPR